jgi:hypothetical protein
VSLANEHTSVVDGLGQVELEHEGLESSLQEILVLETKDKIELILAVIQHTKAVKAAEKGSSLKEPLGVLLLELQKLSRSLTHL